MEKETTRAQPPRPGPPLPRNYVSLAQLQEQCRRLKLEGQRKEEGDEAAARLGRQREEEDVEEEQERLRRPEKDEGEERGKARWPGRGGTVLVRDRRAGRSGPTHWRRKNGGAPEGGVADADHETKSQGGSGDAGVGGVEGREEGNRRDGRGRTTGVPRRRNRSSNATTGEPRSGRTELGAGGARAAAAAAVAAGGEVDPLDRSETEGREEVKPRPIDADEGRKLEQPERGGGAPEMEVVQREGNVDSASSCRGQEGTKVTRCDFLSRDRKVGWRAKLSNPLQPPSGTVHVACKLKDLSIAMPAGGDKVATGGGDGGDRWRRRPTVGRRRGGGYPSFRANGGLGPWRRSRSAADKMTWVRKTESS